MIENIVNGLIGGAVYAFAGLANKPKKESFDLAKFIPTIAVSTIVGLVAGLLGADYSVVADMGMAAGLTAVIEKGYKAITKRIA